MKRILLFITLVAVGITAASYSTSGAQGEKPTHGNVIGQPSAAWTYTYYPSSWRGTPIHPDDAAFMYPYSYQLNYAAGIATRVAEEGTPPGVGRLFSVSHVRCLPGISQPAHSVYLLNFFLSR
ncbi:hypothetical protein SAMN04488128_106400 [Chitinophaga eiseniae]|uniref:Uncharacterized protein n=1 Tax=Chitinophaga eiseniae TaxID=634771 RepID=A0A1T4TVH7_9BACT|nr:hypothetical protein [Chitinophaga eiseniae]SKA44434.1 hypothetical protein SAMN04488128_106400 [Chitinophaga eiseniae]